MSLLAIYNAAFGDSTLRSQVTAAVLHIATYILNEAADIPNHANRLTWAKWITSKGRAELETATEPFLLICAANDSVQQELPAVTDATVTYVVETHVNNVATGAQ